MQSIVNSTRRRRDGRRTQQMRRRARGQEAQHEPVLEDGRLVLWGKERQRGPGDTLPSPPPRELVATTSGIARGGSFAYGQLGEHRRGG